MAPNALQILLFKSVQIAFVHLGTFGENTFGGNLFSVDNVINLYCCQTAEETP